jgi:inner membrane protein
MANGKTHAAVGALLGAAILGGLEYAAQQKRLKQGEITELDRGKLQGKVLLGALGGAVVGVLPDLLEPATHPGHRAFFHSVAFAALGGAGVHKVLKHVKDPELRQAIIAAAAVYGSHLVLDAGTPVGLPVF